MALESRKQALQAALAELLIATASELNDRKHAGWAYCVYKKETPVSSDSTLHALVGCDIFSHDEFNQLLVDAGLLKKPRRGSSHSHGASEDDWETFCASYNIKCCEEKVMNSSVIKAWAPAGKKQSLFLRLAVTCGINPKEQIRGEVEGLITAPKLRSRRFQDARIMLKQTMENQQEMKIEDVLPTSTTRDESLPNMPTKPTSSVPNLVTRHDATNLKMMLKQTMNNLQGVKIEILLPMSTGDELPMPKLAASIPNLLKRPATKAATLVEGISSTRKRARVAEDEDLNLQKKILLSPISKVIKDVYPRLGKSTLENRESRILTWSDDATTDATAPSKTVQRRAEELAYFLNAGACCDAIPAAETIVRMLNRADMSLIRENVERLLEAEYHESNVDRVITEGLVKFMRHHHTKGQRSKDVQNAIDATLTAACFALPEEEETSLRNIASRILGTADASGKLTRHKNKALEMIASHTSFSPKERKTRADAYKEEAACCVSDFCHPEESSRLDTESYRCIKVKDPITNSSEPHPLRVWNEVTLEARYASFSQSDIYKQWQLDNEEKTIGLTSFRAHVCPCVRDPTSESCVDLIYSQCQEYMVAIRNALKYRPSIKNRIEVCECAMHKSARERRAIMELILDATANEEFTIRAEDNILLWEDLLGGRTSEIISATCCKPVEHSTLACQEIRNGTAPILIPWKCTHTATCNDCGVEKKLRIADCPILSGSTESIPVKEWRLAPRAGKNKAGEQNTQIELTDAALPLKDVLARFKIQLDKSRTHYNESEWLRNVRKIDVATLSRNELLIFTDFSQLVTCTPPNLTTAPKMRMLCLQYLLCVTPHATLLSSMREMISGIESTIVMYGISSAIRSRKGRKMTTFFIMPVSKRLLKRTSADSNVMMG
jgi:hypothetical protein